MGRRLTRIPLLLLSSLALGLTVMFVLSVRWFGGQDGVEPLLCDPEGDTPPYHEVGIDLRDAGPQFTPQWTPDDSQIVFAVGDKKSVGPDVRIYAASSDGTSLLPVTSEHGRDSNTVVDHSPSISPDGSRVAYSSYVHVDDETRYFEIQTYAFGGPSRRTLTNEEGLDSAPTWSPDGTRIAFIRYGCHYRFFSGRPSWLYTMAADGSDARKLVEFIYDDGGFIPQRERLRYESAPTWSPDGQLLAYLVRELEREYNEKTGSLDSKMQTGLYTVKTDGRGETKLLGLGLSHQYGIEAGPPLLWTPDGQHITFVGHEASGSGLYAISRNGRDLRKVEGSFADVGAADRAGNLFWSPNDLQILFSLGSIHSLMVGGYENYTAYASWSHDESRMSIARVYRPVVARVIEPPCGPVDGLLSPLGLRVNHLLPVDQGPVG